MIKYLPYKYDILRNLAQVKRILIIVAMETEERALLANARPKRSVVGKPSELKVDLKELKLSGLQVIVARSGVGPVNAGILLTQILSSRKVDAVLLMGVAGALDKKLRPGDVVISTQVIQHDSILSNGRQGRLIAPGELVLSLPKTKQIDPVMRCDSVLIKWALASIMTGRANGVYRGTILSGSEFVGSAERKRKLRALTSDALAVDMEASAVAQICRRLGLPFVAIKTIADRANPGSSIPDDYTRFLKAAADSGSSVLNGLMNGFEKTMRSAHLTTGRAGRRPVRRS